MKTLKILIGIILILCISGCTEKKSNISLFKKESLSETELMNIQKFKTTNGIEKLEAFNAIHYIFPSYDEKDTISGEVWVDSSYYLITKDQFIELIGKPDEPESEGDNCLGYYFNYYPDRYDDVRILFCFNDSTNFMEGILFDGGWPDDEFYNKFEHLKWKWGEWK